MTDANGSEPEDRLRKLMREGKPELPKRFYTTVTVEEVDGARFSVRLDGRSVRTPSKKPLNVPARALAEAIAKEWEQQQTHIDPASMPITRLTNSILDGVESQLDAVRDEIVKYVGSDLVCYRAGSPQALVLRQNAAWDPILKWADDELGARFKTVTGIMPVAQSEDAIAGFERALRGLGPFQIGSLHVLVTLSGSALTSVALARGHLCSDDAWKAAHVDEDWQISQWGEDDEAANRRAMRLRDFEAAATVFHAVPAGA